MSDTLREVQSWMAFWGWKGDPKTGFSHKEDADGKPIAFNGDSTWVNDCEEAVEMVQRQAAIRELERRSRP